MNKSDEEKAAQDNQTENLNENSKQNPTGSDSNSQIDKQSETVDDDTSDLKSKEDELDPNDPNYLSKLVKKEINSCIKPTKTFGKSRLGKNGFYIRKP